MALLAWRQTLSGLHVEAKGVAH